MVKMIYMNEVDNKVNDAVASLLIILKGPDATSYFFWVKRCG